MGDKELIEKTEEFVRETLKEAEGGHDWWHIYRVLQNARHIAKYEEVDQLTVELGALLHDIADFKFHDGDEEIGPRVAREFLESLNVDSSVVTHVENIVRYVSFKGEAHKQGFHSKELGIVQDADRLDAMGAIGIGRTFNYGGHSGSAMHIPEEKPQRGMKSEEYKDRKSTTVNHFYEKLLLLKEKMNTKTGRQLAEERHNYMEKFLEQFYREWSGEA